MRFFLLFSLFIIFVSVLGGMIACEPSVPVKERVPLTIETATGKRTFHVEIADTPQELERGLMFRRELPPDQGMLFIFPTESPVSFWMKNTLIPLDMLFIRADGKIHYIHPMANPRDETGIDSQGDVKMVLEILGGQAQKQGIKRGDTILFKENAK